MIIDETKRITLATVKSFMKKAMETSGLFIHPKSSFNGMTDGIEQVEAKITKVTELNFDKKNDFGTGHLMWFVLGGRDYFQFVRRGPYYGIEVHNCCGSFLVLTENK